MKRKTFFIFALALCLSGSVFLGGCSMDLPSESAASADAEENLADADLQFHTRWYQADDQKLISAIVTFSDDNGELTQGSTDDNGNLAVFLLPANKTIHCAVCDSTGTLLAQSDFIYKVSPDYSAMTIHSLGEEETVTQINIPAGDLDVSAAMFLTENGTIIHANLMPYAESPEAKGQQAAPADDQAAAPTDDQAAAPTDDQAGTAQ